MGPRFCPARSPLHACKSRGVREAHRTISKKQSKYNKSKQKLHWHIRLESKRAARWKSIWTKLDFKGIWISKTLRASAIECKQANTGRFGSSKRRCWTKSFVAIAFTRWTSIWRSERTCGKVVMPTRFLLLDLQLNPTRRIARFLAGLLSKARGCRCPIRSCQRTRCCRNITKT